MYDSSTVYITISHILLISPFIFPILLSFQEIKVVWPMMATAGVCELCSFLLLYFVQFVFLSSKQSVIDFLASI